METVEGYERTIPVQSERIQRFAGRTFLPVGEFDDALGRLLEKLRYNHG